MHSTDREVNLGTKVASQFDKKFDIYQNTEMQERVEAILDRIVAVCDRKELVYSIKIIDEDKVNAVALPGGFIYVFRGLIEKAQNDGQIAGVIAHEVAHITARHGVKRLQMKYGHNALMILGVASGSGKALAGANTAMTALFFEYSQEDELEADRLGVKYMKKAGYDPMDMIGFLELLEAEHEKGPRRHFSYFKTHPGTAKRKSAAFQEATGDLDFKHYLNLMGE